MGEEGGGLIQVKGSGLVLSESFGTISSYVLVSGRHTKKPEYSDSKQMLA